MQYGPQSALIAESFPTRLRYSGAGLGYQLASLTAGGPAPLIAIALLHNYGVWAIPATWSGCARWAASPRCCCRTARVRESATTRCTRRGGRLPAPLVVGSLPVAGVCPARHRTPSQWRVHGARYPSGATMWLGVCSCHSWAVSPAATRGPCSGVMSARRAGRSLSLAGDKLLIDSRDLAAKAVDENVQVTEIVIV